MRKIYSVFFLSALMCSCAGGQKNSQSVEQYSLGGDQNIEGHIKTDYYATATQLGDAIHLELFAIRRGKDIQRDFENTSLWDVKVITPQDKKEIKEVKNRSIRVERVGVRGSEFFDTRLKMSLGFAAPTKTKEIWIDIKSPNTGVEQFYVDVVKIQSKVAGK